MSYNSYALKSLIDEEKVYMLLDSLGVGKIIKDSNGFRSKCPIHGSSNNTTFVVNPHKQLYHCYGSCEYHDKDGDLITLVSKVNKCSFDLSVEYICEVCDIDIKLIEDSEDWVFEELKIKLDSLLEGYVDDSPLDDELLYGVEPIPEEVGAKFIGKKDDEGYILGLGISDSILTLFESGFDSNENRWLLPIRSPDGKLLGFDGRDITGKSKNKWKKRKGLILNNLLGRLDITAPIIKEMDEIVISEGKKDMIALYDAGIKNVSCTYGSSISNGQRKILDGLCSRITIFPDGDDAGYKHVLSFVDKCYPEYEIMVCETPDGMDPADLSSRVVMELYENRIPVEIWLKTYEYRNKKRRKKKK